MKPTDKQIKEFWKWCGIDFFETDGSLMGKTPIGGVFELKVDLNNLFKYAVPKLTQPNEPFYFIGLSYDAESSDWDVLIADVDEQGIEYKTIDNDPALALFWACYEVMKGDKE